MLKGIGTLLTDTFLAYRALGRLLPGYLGWLLLPFAAQILIDLGVSDQNLHDTLTFLVSLAIMLLSVWLTIVIVLLTDLAVAKRNVDDSAALRARAWTLLVPVLWTNILVGLVELAGLLFLVIPAVVFFVWFAFAQLEVVLGGIRAPIEAMAASRALSRGRFFRALWRVFGGLMVIGVFYLLAYALLVGLLILSGTPLETLADLQRPPLWIMILAQFIDLAFLPAFVIYSVLLYKDLKASYAVGTDHRP